MKKIAVEEHIGTVESMLLRYETPLGKKRPFPLSPEEIERTMKIACDVEELRLPDMDRSEISIQILMAASLGFGYVEDAHESLLECQKFNDAIAENVIKKHPDRFRAFASVPLHDPALAAQELERCVKQHGFCGAVVSGESYTSTLLDDPSFDVLWAKAQELDTVIYIHPGETPDQATYLYRGLNVLNGSTWSWGSDTATYVLRMIFNGVFDRFPGLTLMMGHLGEMLPFVFDRIDKRWELSPMDSKNKKRPSQYFKENIYVTLSGNPSEAALRCTLSTMGPERVLFAVDYPFERNAEFCELMEKADLSDEERENICCKNAERIFGL